MTIKDAQTELMHKIWKRAFAQGEIVIPVPTKSDQTNLRFKLYNTAKQVKLRVEKYKEMDLDLANAVKNCSITAGDSPEHGGLFLRVYRQDRNNLLQLVANVLGEKVEVPEQAATMTDDIAGVLARAQAKIEAPDAVDQKSAIDRYKSFTKEGN